MDEGIVVVCQARYILGNAAINVLGVAVVFKVFVVCVNRDGSGGSDQKVTPMIKSPHEGEEFAVVDVIVAFGVGKGL